jgi:hypothetical protein
LNPVELINEVRSHGADLIITEDGRLRVTSASVISPELREALRQRADEIKAQLKVERIASAPCDYFIGLPVQGACRRCGGNWQRHYLQPSNEPRELPHRSVAESRCLGCGNQLRKSKDEERWYCWEKMGGCGATYSPEDIKVRWCDDCKMYAHGQLCVWCGSELEREEEETVAAINLTRQANCGHTDLTPTEVGGFRCNRCGRYLFRRGLH